MRVGRLGCHHAGRVKVEVKGSAYLQTWKQKKLSAISFDIGPKLGGDAVQNTMAGPPTRFADVYVFVLLAHTDKATLDPLDVNQWEFFVLPTVVLNERCQKQKRVSPASLVKLGPVRVGFAGLGAAIGTANGSAGQSAAPQLDREMV